MNLADIISLRDLPPGSIVITVLVVVILLLILFISRRGRAEDLLKYEFITIVAHKFRTPLTHVKWSSDNLFTAEADPYKKQSIADIRQANENLIRLTNTLIEVADEGNSSKSAYDLETVDLCGFTRAVAETAKNAFHEKNISFSVQCPEEEIAAKIDKARMEFALGIILDNACTYTPTGKKVQVTVSRAGNKAVISVTDNGIGIDPSDMPHIFAKFYRAKNARRMDTEGFGVGLFLAKSIVEHHKGKIAVYSEGLDKGSTFSLILKRSHGRPQQSASSSR